MDLAQGDGKKRAIISRRYLMAKGRIASDRVAQGQRMVQITRTDGQPVDVAEWAAELRIPEDSRMETAGWQDEDIPGWWHRLFVWWVKVPLVAPLPDLSPEGRGERIEHG